MSHPENELDNILSQLRSEHCATEAPSSLEDRLVRQTRQAHARTGWLRSHPWSLSFALLAIAAITVGWLFLRTPSHPSAQVHIQSVPAPTQQTVTTPQATQAQPAPQAQPPRQLTAQSARRPRRPNPATVATQDTTAERFVRLPASEGLPESMRPSFVRTRILTSSLPQYGIDVPPFAPPQTVLAEFVVGEDGLPRAIRLIR